MVATVTDGAWRRSAILSIPKTAELMKLYASALAFCATAMGVPAFAGPYSQSIQNSVNLNVQGTAIQTERIGTSLSVSGNNVETKTANAGFGLGLGTAASPTAPAIADNASTGSFVIDNVGMPFSLTQSVIVGDVVATTQTNAAGVIGTPTLYGKSTTQLAGDAGSLAGTLIPATGTVTITAGGAGTTATATQTISLTVF